MTTITGIAGGYPPPTKTELLESAAHYDAEATRHEARPSWDVHALQSICDARAALCRKVAAEQRQRAARMESTP
jgi:hypothetical protein